MSVEIGQLAVTDCGSDLLAIAWAFNGYDPIPDEKSKSRFAH